MRDEEYLFHADVRGKKNIARSARNTRTHCGKSGRVKFPSDYMTKKELNAMNGEVKSYRLNEPMSWKEFKELPDDIKVTYIKLLREKFNCFDSAIAEMMGINKVTFSQEIKRLGLGHGTKHGGNRTWNEKEAFYAWAHGVPAPIPAEDPDVTVTEEEADTIEVKELMTASLNYETEYSRAMHELEKANKEIRYLRDELRLKQEETMWLNGFKAAVEVIFGRGEMSG